MEKDIIRGHVSERRSVKNKEDGLKISRNGPR